jgi:hypothetical protein
MNPLIILNGGVETAATLRSGSKQTVKVRQLPVRLLPLWADLQGDEPALVELYCEQESGWADTLEIESYEAIVALGEELNRPTFDRWTTRLNTSTGLSLAALDRAKAANSKALASAKALLGSAPSVDTPQPRS